ncbi:unnamed protein product (mitochondrion) [Plasmodiophora brassicae]|uniref:Uncharacterized protein n=1 Tax=Plasmodiophora brassicae TaxID=37360 RepID=A0A0G4IL70_PLABS|nr:hypothetical protein PBRA_004608 [Plasmodiophora brassicae]SPQ93535.1 unnamed protein product [Plasmodiophora brassicae]
MSAPLRDRLTIVMTSSAMPANPSTSVLATVVESFRHVPDLLSCDVVVVFDGCARVAAGDGVSVKFKSMRITDEQAVRYVQFQRRAISLVQMAFGVGGEPTVSLQAAPIGANTMAHATVEQYGNEQSITVLKLSQRFGFALAVRQALHNVDTPFVMVYQHDWAFLHHVPLGAVLDVMDRNADTVKYVGFASKRSQKRNGTRQSVPVCAPQVFEGQVILSPLYFWYDKPHVAYRKHYMEFVFGRQRFQAGNFIEDTMGHVMLDEIRRLGASAHAAYGTWTLECDQPTLRHVNGRLFRETIIIERPTPGRADAAPVDDDFDPSGYVSL